MNTMRVLYHLARADFLERIRRYSFLITLGLALFLGYSIASGQMVLVVGQHYRGVINSAWVGGLMSLMINFFLGLFGFYLIKGSINRDYETGVGQIMATTPLKRPLYTLGKWLSNFCVLTAMVVILLIVAVVMQMLYHEDPTIRWWALLSPFMFLVLPFMAFTAALAVLFESIAWLRGGLGNVIYFFLFTTIIVMLSIPAFFGANTATDLMGMGILSNSMGQAAQALYPAYNGNFDITWLIPEFETFIWNGINWTLDIIISRVALFILSIGIATLSAIFFDRFNPSRLLPVKRTKTASDSPELVPAIEATPISNVHLTPLKGTRTHFRFDALFIAELKLLLKGQHRWWYVIAVGLIVAQLSTPLDITRTLLVVAWIWHILVLSGLGCRESRYDTRQIVFSAPRPLMNQLPAAWLSAFVVTALLGSGALLRFIVASESFSTLGWLTGALFIPSLALALGTLTGNSKTFEVLYVLWMYMFTQKVPMFDFIGMTPASPLYIYVPLAFVLMAITVLARQARLTHS